MAKLIGNSASPEYTFSFTAYSLGGQTKIISNNKVEVLCSTAVILRYDGNDSPFQSLESISKTQDGDGNINEIIRTESQFSTDDPACPVEEISLSETTIASTDFPLS